MDAWEPALRDRVLRLQFDAQRDAYAEQYPGAQERMILRDGSPVGWVIVDRTSLSLHGIDIALLSDQRSQGIGARVIRALQEEAAAGRRPMVISVFRSNVRAIALYLRLGFRKISEDDVQTHMEWRR